MTSASDSPKMPQTRLGEKTVYDLRYVAVPRKRRSLGENSRFYYSFTTVSCFHQRTDGAASGQKEL